MLLILRPRQNMTRAAELRREIGIPPQAPVVLFVGRFTCDKGVPELMEAFSQLVDRFPETPATSSRLLRGRRSLPVTTRKALEAHSRVIFAGAVQDTAPYYSIADVLVLPSHREATNRGPRTQAAGKPVVARRRLGS